jgi:hypothetical protein
LRADGYECVTVIAGAIVGHDRGRSRRRHRRLPEFTAPELEHFSSERESTAAITAAAEGHHTLADQRVRQWL